MEEENEKKEFPTPSEASTKEQPSENQIPKTLKAKAGLGKKLIRRRLVKKIVLASKKESSNTKIEGSTELNSVEENHEKDITDENQQDESQQGQQKHPEEPSENQTPDSKVEVELGKKPIRRRLVKKVVSTSKEESCDTKNEDFTKPNSMEENQGKDITNENQQGEGQTGQQQEEEQPFGNQTANSLKAKVELGKKPIRRRLRKQIASASKKESSDTQKEDSKKLNPMEGKQGKDSTNKDQEEESQQAQQKQQEKGELNKRRRDERSNNKGGPSNKSLKKVKSDEKDGATDRLRNEKEKEKNEKSDGNDKKKEKLGGLIFMCSKKTKPDCFHYRVMGVTTTKKDVVLGIKPGLTLFLYDFDLKLMYGIYKASSSGGMKLEPKAFGGAFPAQVRFKVHIDCLPLPESTFKTAIKENYDNKNKFKIELTPKQVRKLTELFRPASLHSSMLPLPNSRVPKVHERETPRGLRESKRERRRHANDSSKSYPTSSHERNQPVAYHDVGYLHRDETPHDLYMSEKEYRTYGLRGERKESIPVRHDSSLEPYLRGQEGRGRQLMTHQDPIYDTIPFARQSNPVDPVYLTEREYRTHDSGVARHELRSRVSPISASATTLDSYSRDPYGTYYNRASLESYPPPPMREEFVSSISSMGRRRESYLHSVDPRSEIDRVDRAYSRYATNALSNYNEEHHYRAARPEQAPAPVSSRYSFAGPSLSYR